MSTETPGRIRRRLSYANVVATLALFLAIGGGTAAAIVIINSKSGFDAVKGVGEESEKVLGVPKVGAVKASCDEGRIIINWKNATDARQKVFVDDGGMNPTVHTLGAGDVGIIINGGLPAPDMLHLLVLRPGNGGTPMAEVGMIIDGCRLVAAHSESSE